ncbi:hypothetical protein BASA84_000477 [Batrachochytrium salamandrivorans]|nr:hypothetical protein BASA84_000477 [Batrachochytrium salamandrivorans]
MKLKPCPVLPALVHCIPAPIQICRSVPTAAAILTEIPPVSPTVVTPAGAVNKPILSNIPTPVEKALPPTVVIPVALLSSIAATKTNELPTSSTPKKTSAGRMSFNDIVTALITELISRGDSERSEEECDLEILYMS